MRQFEIGTTYNVRSACDASCVFSFTVLERAGKSITLRDKFGYIYHRLIRCTDTAEYCLPMGSYSMAPVLRA